MEIFNNTTQVVKDDLEKSCSLIAGYPLLPLAKN